MLIDTHCHLDVPPLACRIDNVLAAARSAGVRGIIIPGIDPDGWPGISALARRHGPEVRAAYGIHPMRAGAADGETLARLAELAPQGVAIGEIGLDYTLTDVSRETQQQAFRAQLRLAAAAGLPILVHCRKAFADLLAIMAEERVERVGGVMHAFSGSPESAAACRRLGLLISAAGTITYRNAVRPVEVIRQTPLDQLLLETDAPDMTPESHKGEPNEPAFIVETARRVAEIKGVTPDKVAQVTTANAQRLFRL